MKKRQTVTARKTILLFSIALATLIITAACASIEPRTERSAGQIFLYGELHGIPRIMERQLEIWGEYYRNQNMRHLFIEYPFFTAEFFNRWMRSDNDDILYEFYNCSAGRPASFVNRYTVEFFRTIKREFPETVFHGVDIGHGYFSEGERFLQYLRDNNLQGTKRYLLTLESIEQGRHFNRTLDLDFRVSSMAANFIREFDRLDGQNVMGIFGSAHTTWGYAFMELPDVPSLAQRLRERYGDSVHTTDLTQFLGPIRTDIITISGVDYEAPYFDTIFFGDEDFPWLSFWRLENAYDDFRDKPANEILFPLIAFPMRIETNQVFIIDATLADGSVERWFFRFSGGYYWYGHPVVTGFIVD